MNGKEAIKKIGAFGLAFLMLWGIIYGYNRLTDGFSVGEMTSSLPNDPRYLSPQPVGEQKAQLEKIFSQPFRYIGKGCQFYAFMSQDGAYVVKFLKHKHLRPLTALRSLPMPKGLRQKCEERIRRRAERVENLFSSCRLAFEELPEETGVLFLHLTRTPAIEQKVALYDKLGLKHTIDIDLYEFVLQKRAIPAATALSEIAPEEAEEKIDQLVQLVLARCAKGIRDRDRSFVQNVAFKAGQSGALFVDIGQFYKDPTILDEEEARKDVARRLGNLRHWTTQHAPLLTPLVDASPMANKSKASTRLSDGMEQKRQNL